MKCLLQPRIRLVNRVASLPENLPKIDFEAYKKQLANPSAIDKLEKGVRHISIQSAIRAEPMLPFRSLLQYLSLQVAYPKDTQNLAAKVNQAEKEEEAKLVAYLKEVAKTIENLKAEVGRTGCSQTLPVAASADLCSTLHFSRFRNSN